LLAIDKDTHRDIARSFFVTGLQVQERLSKDADDSKLSEKDLLNFVAFPELVKARDKLYVEWRTHPDDLKKNLEHLILADPQCLRLLPLTFRGFQTCERKAGCQMFLPEVFPRPETQL
jgi:SPX domain protein involved in polyphosphate accumulation